ncbi:MAG: hypothetical protein ACI9AX_002223, partial [Polaromonas sp.]
DRASDSFILSSGTEQIGAVLGRVFMPLKNHSAI